MTREEAINEIKTWSIPSKNGREVLETLIPELRESEDENLKNKSGYYKAGKFWKASTLWNAVNGKSPQRVPNRYILQECTWNISSLQHFADEVKNVQEVDLNYPIILDMNGNILDGAHRVVKAYLEGKDVDIVYLGDDEWPEPDYDEEKAVKESEDERIRKWLVDYFSSIKETVWIHRDITCGQILAWLEKQKYDRMKPIYDARESFESALEKAWNDYHNGYENVDKLEDDYVECAHAKGFREGYLFGIEKQKEQKPAEKQDYSGLTDLERAIHRGFLSAGVENVPVTIIKETAKECLAQMKPAEWSEEDEKMRDRIIDILNRTFSVYSALGTSSTRPSWPTYKDEIEWLKSLRPSWKPSEEQIYSLGTVVKGMGHVTVGSVGYNLKSLYEQLKRL